MKKVIIYLVAVVMIYSCVEKEESPGRISGTVTDKATGEPIRAAGVQIHTGISTVTGNDGFYEFPELKAGEYTLQVTKTGYSNLLGHKVTVSGGKTSRGDMQIEKLPPSLRVVNDSQQDINDLNFGSATADITRSFNIFNDGPKSLEWELTYTAVWITGVSLANGKLNSGASRPVVVTIDRERLDGGDNTTTIHVTSDNGSKNLTVKATGEVKILATLNTLATSSITATTAMFNGEILTDGTPSYTERGFAYSLSPMPTLENSIAKITASLTASKTYSSTVTGLTLGQTYYVRAYAINKAGTAYSTNEVSFTASMALPVVTTQGVTNKVIGAGTVTLNGSIVNAGDPSYTERGFVYGVVRNPTVEDDTKRTVPGTGTGVFSSNLTGLTTGNVYYVRAYATSTAGTAYGEETVCDFTAVMPVVTTQAVSDISGTAVTFNGTVLSIGDPFYTEKGFVYGTANNPTIEDGTKRAVSGSGTGTFSADITNLTTGTTYYVRAYATNSAGTVYGTSISFVPEIPQYVVLSTAGIMVQIKDINTSQLSWSSAKSLVESSTVGGYTDWRLPTRNELAILYNERNMIGGFVTTGYYTYESFYWSSENDQSYSFWGIVFYNGKATSYVETLNYGYARAVRTLP